MKRNWCANKLLLAIMFCSSFVKGQDLTDGLARGSLGLAEIVISAFGPFFSALLGGSTQYLFEKIMLFFIIVSIVYMVIRKMPIFKDNGAIVLIVTLSISLLSTRFFMFSDFLINTVILPYSVLGVVLSSFLPLLIGFFFIHQFPEGFLRKSFLIFFIVVFFAMWDLRYNEVGGFAWIYFWSAIISLTFFLFDGTIRRAMIREQMKTVAADNHEAFAGKIREEMAKLETAYAASYITESYYERTKRKLSKQLHDVLKF